MQTVTVTNLTYEPQDESLPDTLTFEFDEVVDQAYLDVELKSHIQEHIQESFNTTSVISNFEFAAE